MMIGNSTPASELGADNLNNLDSPLTVISVIDCEIAVEPCKQGFSTSTNDSASITTLVDSSLMQPIKEAEISKLTNSSDLTSRMGSGLVVNLTI